MIAKKDIPEDVVYNILKVIFANDKNIQKTYHAAEFSKEAVNGFVVPLHPGAVKFYEEMGVKLSDKVLPPEMKK